MRFDFLALVCGGIGPDTWDYEVEVGGEGMTISQALKEIESELDSDETVVSIEQVD